MKKKHTLFIVAFLLGLCYQANAQTNFCPISGPSDISDSRTYTYSVFDNGARNYNWTVSGNMEIVRGNRTPVIQIRKKSNATGNTGRVCIFRFNGFSDLCNSCKEISLGCIQRVEVAQTGGTCPFDTNYSFRADTFIEPGSTFNNPRYSWTVSNGTIVGSRTGRAIRVRPNNPQISPGSVTVTVSACGSSVKGSRSVFCEPTCGPNPCFTMSPNPSAEEGFTLTLGKQNFYNSNITSLSKNFVGKSPVKVQLFNQKGILVKTLETSEATTFINMQDLEKGQYFVQIINADGEVQTKSIVTK